MKKLILLLALWTILGVVLWRFYSKPKHDIPPPSAWKWETEQQWIVDQIARDIAHIALHARGGSAPKTLGVTTMLAPEGNRFLVRADSPKIEQSITLNHHLWAEENYVPWARALSNAWKLEAPAMASTTGADLLRILTSPEPATLVREGQRVTKELAQQPLDPELNEQAALLYGAFARREASGVFHDTRPALCRMTAHLAVARASREQFGANGRVASILLLTLTGRETEALEKVTEIESAQPAWAHALRMCNTGDWRALQNPETATLLEQLEYFRALVRVVTPDRGIAFLQRAHLSNRPEWTREVLESSFSVEQGHQFATKAVPQEVREAQLTWAALFGKTLPDHDLVSQLNVTAEPSGSTLRAADELQVLGWSDWAGFYQRELCHACARTMYFLADIWGVPEDARQFSQQMSALFAGLRLYPAAQALSASDQSDFQMAVKAAAKLCANDPQLLTAGVWVSLTESRKFGPAPASLPRPGFWFRPELPFGTAYDFSARYYDLHTLHAASQPFWDEVRAISPNHIDVLRAFWWKKFGAGATADQIASVFAPILDYNLRAMRELADHQKSDAQAYTQTMQKVCELDPDSYLALGKYLSVENRPEEAARAFQTAYDRANNRVAVANQMGWLVNYYFEHDRTDDALKIAQEGAEVYSHSGLETAARLMERLNRLDEAEKLFDNIRERYGDAGPLGGFHFRHRGEKPGSAASYDAVMRETFPKGMEKVALADFHEPPNDGVVIKTSNDLVQFNGLKTGDVFVALDGCRVHNVAQYLFVRGLSVEPQLDLVVWDRRQYRAVKPQLVDRQFHNDIETYKRAP